VVLDPEVALGWFAERGIDAASLAELAADPAARDMLQRAIDEVMMRFSNVERVKRVAVLADEWLPDGDELTPTSKLKRRSILAKYADQIEAIYG
jgi:long-chain acyl-CoA synthetase